MREADACVAETTGERAISPSSKTDLVASSHTPGELTKIEIRTGP